MKLGIAKRKLIFDARRKVYKARVTSMIKRRLEAIENSDMVADIDGEVDHLCVYLRDIKPPTIPKTYEDLTAIELRYYHLERRYLTEKREASE